MSRPIEDCVTNSIIECCTAWPGGSDKLHIKDRTEKCSAFQQLAFSTILYKSPAKL